MVPDKFNMVDMEGIDLIESQGLAVTGLYQKLVDSTSQCRYQCLYNWKFDGIIIPPSYVEIKLREGEVWINEGVSVDEEDVIHIYSIEPEPAIEPLQVTENGIYQAPEGVDGYSPVNVNVDSGTVMLFLDREPVASDGEVGDYCLSSISGIDGFCLKINTVARGSNTAFTYWGTSAFRVVLEDGDGVEHDITDLQDYSIYLSPSTIGNNTSLQNQLFTNQPSGTYIERNGLPGFIVIHCDLTNYKLKSFSLSRRSGTSFIDYLVDFDVYWLDGTEVQGGPILQARGLTGNDWPNNELVEFSVDASAEVLKLFYKTESGWIQII